MHNMLLNERNGSGGCLFVGVAFVITIAVAVGGWCELVFAQCSIDKKIKRSAIENKKQASNTAEVKGVNENVF